MIAPEPAEKDQRYPLPRLLIEQVTTVDSDPGHPSVLMLARLSDLW
jgi:hypothetical protein